MRRRNIWHVSGTYGIVLAVSKRYFGSVRKLPSGRYQARYTGPDGRPYTAVRPDGTSLTFDNKKLADSFLSRVHADIQAGTWISPKAKKLDQVTFRDYAESWFADQTLKPSTRAQYRSLLDLHILPSLGDLLINEVKPITIRGWFARQGKRNRPTSRAHAYSLVHSIFATAVQEELIETNPCRVRGGGSRKIVRNIRPATLPELATITAAMPEGYGLMVLLAAWCALRRGEVTELRRKDIDIRNGMIHIRRAVTWPDGVATVGAPKSDPGTRDIAIPPHLMTLIKDHVSKLTPDALLFPAPKSSGQHIRPSTIQYFFGRARKQAKREDLRFHDLRHTGAVLAAATGATLKELMSRLGHSSPRMAMHYQHVAADRDRVIANALSELAAQAASPEE